MQWLDSSESTKVSFPAGLPDNVIITDSNGVPYSKDEFPLDVKKGSDFKFKVEIKPGTETDDAEVKITDKDGKKIEPSESGEYSVAIGNDEVELNGVITYPVIVDLNGGQMKASKPDVPEG